MLQRRKLPVERTTLALGLVAFVLALGFPASPAQASSCDTIRTDSGTELVFYKQHMRCSTAKKYAHRLMRDGSYDPRNFKCKRQSPTGGGCTHKYRPQKWFIFYPPH